MMSEKSRKKQDVLESSEGVFSQSPACPGMFVVPGVVGQWMFGMVEAISVGWVGVW